jgi:hypothetical protein
VIGRALLQEVMAESPQRAAGVRRLALSLGLTDYPRWTRDELARQVSEAAIADSLAGLADAQAERRAS